MEPSKKPELPYHYALVQRSGLLHTVVSRHRTFDDAMSALAACPGKWEAWWSLGIVGKGDHLIEMFVNDKEST